MTPTATSLVLAIGASLSLAVVGCGGGGSGTDGGPSGNPDAGTNHTATTQFATSASSWTVPTVGTGAGYYLVSGSSSGVDWATIDMDGDGKPDLVQTAQNGVVLGSSSASWQVYLNTGNGFSATATTWTVPTLATTEGFYLTSGSSSAGGVHWATIDIDGDGKPDLVQTAQNGVVLGSSSASWQVYRNTGSGFATTATTWTVPTLATAEGFYLTGGSSSSGGVDWTTIDIDGDNKPDLVQTAQNGVVLGSSSASWQVYRNTGSGFATTATTWTVPTLATAEGFYLTSGGSSAGGVHWATIDIDGDGKPDLVQTAQNGVVLGSSSASWQVYLNTGTRFATTATTWKVPTLDTAEGFYLTSGGSSSGGVDWTTIDIDGDGKPDLVQTAQNGVVLGSSSASWQVYRNTGNGFATTPKSWTVPTLDTAEGFYLTSGGSSSGGVYWTTMDLNGDGRLDSVQTAENSIVLGTNAASWSVYLGQ